MRRITLALLVITLMRVTFAYADTNSPITIQSFFLGNSPQVDSTLNQVLALLIGPEGKPGPAGVAGRDGFIGMNGKDGLNGLPGAPGAVGPAGPAGAPGAVGPAGPAGVVGTVVAVSTVPLGSSECSGLGGTKFVAGATTTYACNGSGGSGGGTFGFSQGTVNIGTCDADASISFTFPVRWSGSDFYFKSIDIANVDGNCIDATLRVYLKVKSSGPLFVNSGQYDLGDVLTCPLQLTEARSNVASSPRSNLNNGFSLGQSLSCSRESSGGVSKSAVLLGEVGTRDLVGTVGFEIS